MKKLLIVLVLLFLSGCAGTPYLDVGLAYRIDSQSDWFLRSERNWSGRPPIFEIEAGLEWPQASCGIYHWSHLRDGNPWNNSHPELYEMRVRCLHRFGGIK